MTPPWLCATPILNFIFLAVSPIPSLPSPRFHFNFHCHPSLLDGGAGHCLPTAAPAPRARRALSNAPSPIIHCLLLPHLPSPGSHIHPHPSASSVASPAAPERAAHAQPPPPLSRTTLPPFSSRSDALRSARTSPLARCARPSPPCSHPQLLRVVLAPLAKRSAAVPIIYMCSTLCTTHVQLLPVLGAAEGGRQAGRVLTRPNPPCEPSCPCTASAARAGEARGGGVALSPTGHLAPSCGGREHMQLPSAPPPPPPRLAARPT